MTAELVKRVTGGSTPRLTSRIGWRTHPVTGAKQTYHTGNDYAMPVGTKIYMPYNGKVVFSGLSGGYGLNIETTPFVNKKRLTMLAHLSKTYVKSGDYVKQGTLIALSGGAKNDQPNAGSSTGPHLHLADGEFKVGEARAYHDQSSSGTPMQWQDAEGTRYWDNANDFEKEKNEYLGVKPSEDTNLIPETGYSLKLKRNTNVRSEPSTSAKIVKTLPSGTVVPYKAWIKTNGYDWKQLEDGNYIANGPYANNRENADIIKSEAPKPALKSNREIADEVKLGKWDNGAKRVKRLQEAGYDPVAIQAIVDADKASASPSIKVGDKVKARVGARYQNTSSGKSVPAWAGEQVNPIVKIDGSKAHVGGSLNSWLLLSDLTKVN